MLFFRIHQIRMEIRMWERNYFPLPRLHWHLSPAYSLDGNRCIVTIGASHICAILRLTASSWVWNSTLVCFTAGTVQRWEEASKPKALSQPKNRKCSMISPLLKKKRTNIYFAKTDGVEMGCTGKVIYHDVCPFEKCNCVALRHWLVKTALILQWETERLFETEIYYNLTTTQFTDSVLWLCLTFSETAWQLVLSVT